MRTIPRPVIRNLSDARAYGAHRAESADLSAEPTALSNVVSLVALASGATPARARAAGTEAFIILRRRIAAAHASGERCPGNGCLCGAPQSDGTRATADPDTAAAHRQLAND